MHTSEIIRFNQWIRSGYGGSTHPVVGLDLVVAIQILAVTLGAIRILAVIQGVIRILAVIRAPQVVSLQEEVLPQTRRSPKVAFGRTMKL
jgi:hypothetical protein